MTYAKAALAAPASTPVLHLGAPQKDGILPSTINCSSAPFGRLQNSFCLDGACVRSRNVLRTQAQRRRRARSDLCSQIPALHLGAPQKAGILPSTINCSSAPFGRLQNSFCLDGACVGYRNVLRTQAQRRRRARSGLCSHLLCYASASASVPSEDGNRRGRYYFNVTGFPFPLGPFLERKTICKEVDKGRIWIFEQEQALGFSSVTTNIRMTVIKLKGGGLWVHAPIAPTKECVQLVKGLEAPVKYIILPTFAYEHKIFVGPFSRKFPKAQIWVAPRQWSWPLNLPLEFFGIFSAKFLRDMDNTTPWAKDIDQKVFSSPEVGIGPYVEVAFFHKASRTLLVTDAVIFVPKKPPEVVSKQALLDAAKNGLAVKLLSKGKVVPDDPIIDNERTRQIGWERMVLQILFLGPSNLLEPKKSFIQMSEKLIVSPIIKTLVFSKVPEKVKLWVNNIAKDWRFKRIIPCHFAAPVAAGPSDFKAAFGFLNELLSEDKRLPTVFEFSISSLFSKAASYFPPDDMKTLSSLDEFLVSVGAVKKTVSNKKL